MPNLPDLSPRPCDIATGRYTPRRRWSAEQHATYAAARSALGGRPTSRSTPTVIPVPMRRSPRR